MGLVNFFTSLFDDDEDDKKENIVLPFLDSFKGSKARGGFGKSTYKPLFKFDAQPVADSKPERPKRPSELEIERFERAGSKTAFERLGDLADVTARGLQPLSDIYQIATRTRPKDRFARQMKSYVLEGESTEGLSPIQQAQIKGLGKEFDMFIDSEKTLSQKIWGNILLIHLFMF